MRFNRLRRREFVTLLGGAAVAWPLAARAQQPAKLPTIGFLVPGTPSSHGQWVAAFVQRLRELGWIDTRTVAVEYRWAEGRSERFAEIADEFVHRMARRCFLFIRTVLLPRTGMSYRGGCVEQ